MEKIEEKYLTKNAQYKDLYEENGYIYYIKEDDASRYLLDKGKHIVSIVDYRDSDGAILVLPEKIGDNYVDYYYEAGTMQTPNKVKYLVMEQPTKINAKSFPNSDIEGIIALREFGVDKYDELEEWNEYTKGFLERRNCKLFNDFTPDLIETHFEVSRKILIDFFRKFSEIGTREDIEYLLDKEMTIGDMYMEAIVGDNIEMIERLEKYGFPVCKEFAKNGDEFLNGLIDEVRHFRAKSVEQYFAE